LNGAIQFECHVGHVFSLESMLSEQAGQVETALWAAVRALEESEQLALRMALTSPSAMSERFKDRAQAMRQHAGVLRAILLSGSALSPADSAGATAAVPPEDMAPDRK